MLGEMRLPLVGYASRNAVRPSKHCLYPASQRKALTVNLPPPLTVPVALMWRGSEAVALLGM